MVEIFARKTYFALALDPVHIGTGGYRIGRVDNTIIRDFDEVPKIPGTSIEGSARSYAYLAHSGGNKACAVGKKIEEMEPCGRCEICYSFGYTSDKESIVGMTIFSDSKILFFPVASLVGPVWVTSPSRLKEIGVDSNSWQDLDESELCIVSEYLKTRLESIGYINFGWLLLRIKRDDSETITHSISTDTTFGYGLTFKDRELDKKEIFERLIIVSDSVYFQIVNSNLEVRTSVSIDPTTGVAEEGALFTYEAIPRGTIFYFDLIFQDPAYFDVKTSISRDTVISTVESGMNLFEILGIGGMGTRGFGKIRVFGLDKFDEVELTKRKVENEINRVQEIEKRLENKEIDDKEREKLEKELQRIRNQLKTNSKKFATIFRIYDEKLSKLGG